VTRPKPCVSLRDLTGLVLGDLSARAFNTTVAISGDLNPWLTMIRGSWMTGGSVEATLELWASSLRDVKGRIGPLFQQARMAHSAGLFLDALLGPEQRKTGWMRAEAAGDPGPSGAARPGSVGRRGAARSGARLCP
jgi:hypothetical protein